MSSTTPLIKSIEQRSFREEPLPAFRSGDTVKVWVRIREGAKSRLQAFEGDCIRKGGAGNRATFTVRKISYGVGVERVFPVHSPNVEKIEVIKRGKVRQGRLYYLRDLRGKAARIKERTWDRSDAEAAAADKKPRRKKRGKAAKAAKQG